MQKYNRQAKFKKTMESTKAKQMTVGGLRIISSLHPPISRFKKKTMDNSNNRHRKFKHQGIKHRPKRKMTEPSNTAVNFNNKRRKKKKKRRAKGKKRNEDVHCKEEAGRFQLAQGLQYTAHN